MSRTLRQSGFTLVELMAASVITAFLAMVAVGGMVSVTSTRSSLGEVTEVMDELRYAADLMRQDLANVHRNRREMLFEGALDGDDAAATPHLRFRTIGTAAARTGQPEGDVYEVEYLFFEGQDGRMQLARRVCPVVGPEQDPLQTAGGVLTLLSEHISYFGVRYFDGTQWTTVWPAQQQLMPTLIEVSLAARITEKEGKEKVYSKQVVLTVPHFGEQSAATEEEDSSVDIEFSDPESGAGQ